MALVMGTAGHIDHGKTTLIQALTGIQCDRLAEEKKRGITIELGFAYFNLPEKNGKSLRMGIIDVPGHEKFVKNMVAGANGIDFVLLVIAADEGVMPQTREHLEICSLLNIRDGIIALTKKDMVEPELLELAKEDIKDFVKGTFLENAPIFAVSSHTGEGLDELKQAITEKNYLLQPKRRNNIFRLPVDRVFSLKGYGTLITGTLLSGSASVGDEVCIMPQNLPSKIRSIQNHGQSTEKALAGNRTSVNLANVEVSDIERGDIIAFPQTLFPSRRWLVSLTCLASSLKSLRHRTEIHFHHGTKEIMAKLYLQNKDTLNPGETCLCEVRFPEPLCGVFGDKCVLRSFSPLQTVAGASVINPLPDFPKLKSIPNPDSLLCLEQKFLDPADSASALYEQLKLGNKQGISHKQLTVLCNMDEKSLEKALQQLLTQKKCILFDKENKIYIADCHADGYERLMLEKVREYHKKEPLKQYMPKASLLSAFEPPKLAHYLLEKLAKQQEILINEDGVCLASHTVSLNSQEHDLKTDLFTEFSENPQNPPLLKELSEKYRTNQKDLLNVLALLVQEQKLIKITEGMYFSAAVIADIKGRMLEFYKNNADMSPSDFKEISKGLTRKYAIPVLEYFDKERITIRVGDVRRLRNTGLLQS